MIWKLEKFWVYGRKNPRIQRFSKMKWEDNWYIYMCNLRVVKQSGHMSKISANKFEFNKFVWWITNQKFFMNIKLKNMLEIKLLFALNG